MQLVELAASLGETLTSLSVQNTTLDDVGAGNTVLQLEGRSQGHHGAVVDDGDADESLSASSM